MEVIFENSVYHVEKRLIAFGKDRVATIIGLVKFLVVDHIIKGQQIKSLSE